MPNPFGKSAPLDNPYAVYRNSQGWELSLIHI